jgi:hypothetical protein
MKRFGMIVTSPEIAATLPRNVKAIKSWGNNVIGTKANEWVKASGLYSESIYDAAHGRRYILMLIPMSDNREQFQQQRSACFDAIITASRES